MTALVLFSPILLAGLLFRGGSVPATKKTRSPRLARRQLRRY